MPRFRWAVVCFDTAVISGTLALVKSQFIMNAITEGWFVSSGLAGCIVGVFTAGIFSDKAGRKPVLLIAGILFLITAFGCALADTLSTLIAFRLIGGIGVGIVSVVSPMFISELAPAKIRERMVAFYQLSITVGIVLTYFSNAYLLSFSHQKYTAKVTTVRGCGKCN